VNCTSEEISIFIENSKPQFYAGLMKPKEIGGIGLVNVQKRLELIYPNKHELSIHNEPERFQVILKIKQK
jgi:LytS/YehU family sensor histidine kinase